MIQTTEWITSSLLSATSLLKDGTHGSHIEVVEGPYLLSAKNIKNGIIHYDSSDRKISNNEYQQIYKNYNLQLGDLLLTVVGTIGRVALVKDLSQKIAFQRSVAILRTKEHLNSSFVFYLFQTDNFQNQLLRNKVVSAQPGIYLGDIAKLNINYPLDLEEQERIANFFTLIDARIGKQEDKIAALKEQKKGYVQRIFDQELRFKADDGSEYPEWELATVGTLARITKGFTPSTKNNEFWQGSIPWLSIAGLNHKYVIKENKTISSEALGKKNLIPANTLIMSFKLTVGKLAILQKPMMTNEAICAFLWKSSVNTEYAYYALQNMDFSKLANQAVQGLTLNDETLKAIPFPLAHIEEQKKIGQFLAKLDERIDVENSKLEILKEQKKGYLQQIFA